MSMYVHGGKNLLQALRKVQRQLGSAESVRVGFLAGATYPATYRSKKAAIRAEYRRRAKAREQGAIAGAAGGLSVAQVAYWNELGDPAHGRPARPFFRTMIELNKGHWGQDLADLLKANGYQVDKALAPMGELMRAELQASIRDGKWPKLSDATEKAKGFDKPLIDTAHMLNSVDYEVQS